MEGHIIFYDLYQHIQANKTPYLISIKLIEFFSSKICILPIFSFDFDNITTIINSLVHSLFFFYWTKVNKLIIHFYSVQHRIKLISDYLYICVCLNYIYITNKRANYYPRLFWDPFNKKKYSLYQCFLISWYFFLNKMVILLFFYHFYFNEIHFSFVYVLFKIKKKNTKLKKAILLHNHPHLLNF